MGLTDGPAEALAMRRLRADDRLRAQEKWRQGKVVPHRITSALDLRGLYGPEVDEACGVTEPAVDQWEAGYLYPTFAQLERLSLLTGFPVGYFLLPPGMMPDGPLFLCNRTSPAKSEVIHPGLVVSEYSHTALVMAGIRQASAGPGAESLF